MDKKCKVVQEFQYMDGKIEKTMKEGTMLTLVQPSEGSRVALTLLNLAPVKIDDCQVLVSCDTITPIESDAEEIAVGVSRVSTTSLTAYDVDNNKMEVPEGSIIDIIDPSTLEGDIKRDLTEGLKESREKWPWCHIRVGYAPAYDGYLLVEVLEWTKPLEEGNK
jgi:hypothetical protein